MITAVLCAAGSGKRARLPENKILREYLGMPVLLWSLSAFAPLTDEILVVCREEDEGAILPLLSPFPQTQTVRGGPSRAESVKNALARARGEIVLVHDAARPFVSSKLIRDCIRSVETHGSGVCALPLSDTAVVTEGGRYAVPPRESVFSVQTPQGFRTEALKKAYAAAEKDGPLDRFTDDGGLYAAYVSPPRLIPGDPANRKLTYPEDFLPAERVGFGTDVHAFAHADEFARGIARLNLNYIKLGGVAIPSDRALEAHSDGDVLVHALIDALLSAAGLRDVGYYFPNDDPRYAGADSLKLLAEVLGMVRERGLTVKNVSASVLAERPRLSPYIEEINRNLAAALSCESVAVAAGTNEKLGYIGEGKGIAAYCLVLLEKRRP